MAKVPQGVMVPLVTPFFEDESIDFESYKKIIDYTIDGGMHGILVGGSTGEYHMMSLEEMREILQASGLTDDELEGFETEVVINGSAIDCNVAITRIKTDSCNGMLPSAGAVERLQLCLIANSFTHCNIPP